MSENCQACVKKMVASLPGCLTKEEASEALVSEPAGACCQCCNIEAWVDRIKGV